MPKPYKYYHIYNHTNGFGNIFKSDENYRFFLEKHKLYISPVAGTFAYCLIPNHFHLLIKIKSEEELKGVLSGGKNPQGLTKLHPEQNIKGFEAVSRKNPQGLTEPKPLQNLEGFEVGDGKNHQGFTEPKPLQNLEGFEMGDGVYNKLTGQQFSKRFVYLTIEKLIYRVQINS